jgi:hypothetical protein
MNLWPPEYLTHYVYEIKTFAAATPEAARDLLVTVLGIDDDSDEITYITQGVLTMTSRRRDDFNHAKYAVGQAMPGFVARAGLRHAVPVMAKALEHCKPGLTAGTPRYPIRTTSAEGQVDGHALDLNHGPGHGAAKPIVEAFANGLVSRDSECFTSP